MTFRLLAPPLLLLVLAPAVGADVTIVVRNGVVDVRAVAAPIMDVLERLGEKTAMRVVFSARPTTIVSLDLRGQRQPRAVEEVLRHLGTGFGHAFALAPDRSRVASVIVTGSGGAVVTPSDRFQPPPGKGDALEAVPEAWELEAQRDAARLAAATAVPSMADPPAAASSADPNEPTFGHGIDPFTPPDGRGDRPEPVPDHHRR